MKLKACWALQIAAFSTPRSRLSRPTFDLSQPSIPHSRLQQPHFGPPAFARLPKPDIMSRPSNLSNLPFQHGRAFIQKLKVLSNKRNRSTYDVAGVVSDQDLQSVVKVAADLQNAVQISLGNEHRELLGP